MSLRKRLSNVEKCVKPFQGSDFSRTLDASEAAGEGVWAIRPVPILEFAETHLGLDTLSEPQLDVLNGIFGDDPEHVFFNIELAVLKIGQRGGKNFVTTIAVVYGIYLWCCLTDPHHYFNLKPHETFDVLNFSQVNEQQAKNVFFKGLTTMMRNVKDPETGDNWFVRHMGFQIKEYGRGDIKEREMTIPSRHPDHGGISVFCLDSRAQTVEGYLIWIFIMDEPSRANTPVMYEKAKHQFNTAYTNNKGSFPFDHRLGIAFSYPEQETNDLLVELFDQYSQAPSENKMEIAEGILTAWFDTYVFNPKDREKKIAQYEKDRKVDPVDADRRWRAIVPPNVFGFFMPHMGKIQDCANPNLPQPVKYKKTLTRRKAKVKGVNRIVDFTALELFDIKGDTRDRRWGGDFAVSKDRLVLAGGYNETLSKQVADLVVADRDRETGKEIEKIVKIGSYPVVDIILIWEPTKNHPIDFLNVEDVVTDLFENRFPNSRSLHFDRWNTESIKHKLLNLGIYDCETLTFSNAEQLRYGRIFRHLVWNNACEYPDHPLLQKEMNQLMLLNNVKLDHPTGGSKDLWDAVSICVNLLIEHAYERKGLDIGISEGAFGGQTRDYDEESEQEINTYDEAYRGFINTFHRAPHSDKEMADFLYERVGRKKSPSEILYLHQSWEIWREDLPNRVIGLSEFQQGDTDLENLDLGFDLGEWGLDIDDSL